MGFNAIVLTGLSFRQMKLTEPTIFDILSLCNNARPDEIEQYEALIGPWSMDNATNEFYNRDGIKFAIINDSDVAVCAGGWDQIFPGVWQGWMIGTDNYWKKYWRSITKLSRFTMNQLFESGARRLQVGALTSRTKTCDWYIRGLKMRPEGIYKGFGLKGEDMSIFARLKENT